MSELLEPPGVISALVLISFLLVGKFFNFISYRLMKERIIAGQQWDLNICCGKTDAGVDWNHRMNGNHAMILIILAASWKQISYNFLFFIAGMQAIPRSLIEAAAMDGAGPFRRFWTIVFPLLSPTTFFLLVVNMVYAFFDTFGIVHAVTKGGPSQATQILVYKVYNDGFIGLDLGGSAAQSVILMAIVIGFTVIQFKYIERRVIY